MRPARWRKEPHGTGLRSIGQRPRGYELRRDGETLIRVAPIGGGWRSSVTGWYWVAYFGSGRNTRREGLSFKTKNEARADADTWFKALPVATEAPTESGEND